MDNAAAPTQETSKGSGGKGSRRTRRGGPRHSIATKDEGLKNLLGQVIRLSFHKSQQVRQLKAVGTEVYIMRADSPVLTAVEAEQTAWSASLSGWRARRKDADERGDSTGTAPSAPSPTMMMGLMEALLKSEVGAKNRQVLTATVTKLKTPPEECELDPPGWIYTLVPMLRVDRLFGESARGMTMATPGLTRTERMAIQRSLIQLGAEFKTGCGPPGGLERDLADWLKALD